MDDALALALAASTSRRDVTSYRPELFDAKNAQQRAELAALVAAGRVAVVDEVEAQLDELARSRRPRDETTDAELRALKDELGGGSPPVEVGVWAHYPWLDRVVHVLPEALHRELRLDRNRYKITGEEQALLLRSTIAVAGLSVGRAVVSTLAREGVGGTIRLADFDELAVSNLNRVLGGIGDVGVAKVILAAREIAEVDPWIDVQIFPRGVEEATLDAFVVGADVVVDECDDLAMKIRLRERARAARIPVVMATSDRGMLDVERFDRDPSRRLFHGLIGDVDSAALGGLTAKQKVPFVLRVLEASALGERMAASLVEVKETLATWPQLASAVALGGAMVATAVRRIILGELTASGRFLVDLEELVADDRVAPVVSLPVGESALAPPEPAATEAVALQVPPPAEGRPSREEIRMIVACATLAPSGGNVQPWRFVSRGGELAAFVDPERSPSLLNFAERATYLALGAALEGAVRGASALGLSASVSVASGDAPGAPVWTLSFDRGADRDLSRLTALRERCSNRRVVTSPRVPDETLRAIQVAGTPLLAEVVPFEALSPIGEALGDLDRVRFASARFRRELFSELRWTREEALARRDGIDLASLELDATDRAVMEVLRGGAGMETLARLELGGALGAATRTAFKRAGGALVLRAGGTSVPALVGAGRGLLRLWMDATGRGLAVHPWGTPFLFQCLAEDESSLSSWERAAISAAAEKIEPHVSLEHDRPVMLFLRLSVGDPPTARSVRRSVDDVLTFD